MWKTVRLGEVCDFSGGSQPPKRDFVYEPQDGYVRLIQIRDFKSDKNICYVPAAKANKLCSEEDILIGRYGASVGKILRGLSGSYNVALMKARPDERILDKRWLHTYLTSPMFQKPLAEVSSRSAQNGFSKKDIYDFRLPLPPLAEQKRIVERLDKAFVEIDKAIATAEAKEGEVERLKASTLSAMLNRGAHSGTSITDDEEDSVMWETVKLSDLFKVGSSRRVLKSDWRSQGVPFYRGREITRLSLEGSVENELFITEDLYKSLATKSGVPSAGDILITAIGTIGNTYVVKNKDRFYFKDASVLWLSKTADVSSEYVQHWLRTPDFFEQLDEGNGATVDTLTIKKMASISLPLPPLAEQKRIVERLDRAFAEIEIVSAKTQSCLGNYSALKAAILKQELTPSEAV